MADMLVTTADGSQRLVEAVDGVWEHSCGSQFFYLEDDGSVSCTSCGSTLTGFRWTRGVVS